MITSRVMPPRILWLFGGVITTPSFTTNKLLAAPSMARPSLIKIASMAPSLAACWLMNRLGSRAMALISQRFQRISSAVIAFAPRWWVGTVLAGMAMGCTMANTVGAMLASGNA